MTGELTVIAEIVEAQCRAAQAEYARQIEAVRSMKAHIEEMRKSRHAMSAGSADTRQLQLWLRWWESEMARLNTALAASLADIEPAERRLRLHHGRREAIGTLQRREESRRAYASRKRQANDLLDQIVLRSGQTS